MKKVILVSVAVLGILALAAVGVSATDGNLVQNGSFELPAIPHGTWTVFPDGAVPGWTIEWAAPPGDRGPELEFQHSIGYGDAYDGHQYVELDSYDPTKIIQQVTPTTPGYYYELSYAWRPRPDSPENIMGVYLNDDQVGYHSATGSLPWSSVSYPFQAVSASATIAFAELGPDDQLGMFLDAVSLSCHTAAFDLIAGGGNPASAINVGDLLVWEEDGTLHIKYLITDADWCITETHLQVATSLEGIPQKNGNPIPGKFEENDEHDCVSEVEYTYTGLAGDLVIAAHAVVQKVVTAAPYPASAVVGSDQGLRKDGTPVRSERSTPEQGLAFEPGQNESNFFSLGFGGSIIVEFACPIRNGEGNDVKVIEDTWGSYPLEKAGVYASQDGIAWTYLGEADNTNMVGIHTISEFDLGALDWAKYIKIVDTTDPGVHGNTADGYDLNAVLALQDCVQEETAWSAGDGFPGKNWATYSTYTVGACQH